MSVMAVRTVPSPLATAIDRLRAGDFVALLDAEDRQDQAHVIVAAEHTTPERVTFMACEARGLVCVHVSADLADDLELYPPGRGADTTHGDAYTASVEARIGVTTGISAADRAHTIRTIADPASRPHDLVVPGHIFPMRARTGGVRRRAGHSEAAVDLAALAGLRPAVASCAILEGSGDVARGEVLQRFCDDHRIPLLRISDLADWLDA